MPSDLSSYLAANYLTPDTKPPTKKRKRKHDKSSNGGSSGLLIQDDDDWGSGKSKSRRGHDGDGDHDNDDLPVTVGKVKEARKTTKSNWKTVGAGGGGGGGGGGGVAAAAEGVEHDAADAILASVAAETAAARAAEDDAPTVAEMTDGTRAGLQSAAAVTAQLEARRQREREQFEAERRAGLVAAGEETHYRDATGRRVDVSMKRAEARRAAQEAEDKERAAKEALKGEVQVEEARRRRERLEDAKGMSLARGADDEEMNRELREETRWNDPMARFLAAEADRGGGGGDVGPATSSGRKAPGRRPVYKGPAPPNRYGIRPGYRWDGVDRSNGFEAERFKAINRRERNKGLDYAWQMDE